VDGVRTAKKAKAVADSRTNREKTRLKRGGRKGKWGGSDRRTDGTTIIRSRGRKKRKRGPDHRENFRFKGLVKPENKQKKRRNITKSKDWRETGEKKMRLSCQILLQWVCTAKGGNLVGGEKKKEKGIKPRRSQVDRFH